MTRRATAALLTAIFLATIFAGGCTKPAPPADPATARPPAHLKLLVVDDPAMFQKITRLRGEWEARAGGTLEIEELPAAKLSDPKLPPADVIIYPASELGSLAERNLLRPLPAKWLDRPDYNRSDVLDLVGQRETTWGTKTYAVPLGSPVFVCFYRRDLFEKYGRHPPQTWREYQELVEFFGKRENLPGATLPDDWTATIEPLAPGWAGKVLLARAAAYAKHRDYYATLFDKETMEPQIESEPFARALTELVAAAPKKGKTKTSLGPDAARNALLTGHAAMALSWPTAASAISAATEGGQSPFAPKTTQKGTVPVGFAELPGSPDVFNPRDKAWRPRQPDDDPHVPLLGIAGRLGSVVSGTHEPDAAFALLVWLSGDEWGSQICSASPATTLFRRSQATHAERWVEPGVSPTAAREYGEVVVQSLSRPQCLQVPRIQGKAEYMAALDDAVQQAVLNERSSAEALKQAAGKWRAITERLGLDKQRAAYARSLGLEPNTNPKR